MELVIKTKRTPHNYQVEAINFALDNIEKKDVLIAAAPNAGKTYMSALIIKELIKQGKRVLCSIHGTNALKTQYYESIIDELGEDNVSMYHTSNLDLFDTKKPVQIVIPQNKKQVDACVRLYGEFDVLVVDEAHKYFKADTVQYFVNNCVKGNTLLLTGSPESFKPEIEAGDIIAKYISVETIETMFSGQYEKNLETLIYTNDVMLSVDDFNEDGEVKGESHTKLESNNNTKLIQKLLVGDFGKTIIYTKTVKQSNDLEKDLIDLNYSVLSSNYENDSQSDNVEDFKKLSGNHILIVVDRCSEGFDDPNVSVIDMTYSKNIGLTYQRYSRVIRASKDETTQKRYIKIVPNDEDSANVYTHIMTAVKMLLKQEYYVAFNGKNFSIPTIQQKVKVDKEGCVRGYTERPELIVDDINSEIITSKSETTKTIEELVNDDNFKVTLNHNNKKYLIKKDDFDIWRDKLDGLDYTIKIEKTKNNIDNSLLIETATLSGVYFDITNKHYEVTTQYAVSNLQKVLNDIYGLRKPEGYWTLETCKEDALKYNKASDWSKNNSRAYEVARKNNWLEECCSHMEKSRKPEGYWTLETCKEDALNYTTKSEWQKNNGSAYNSACKNNWLEECCAHMEEVKKPNGYWNFNKCKEDALKYKTKTDWQNNSKAYEVARQNGWLEECCSHMEKTRKPTNYWALEACKEDALKYNTKNEWFKNSKGAYKSARKNGWLEECCSHMEKYATEQEHIDFIKNNNIKGLNQYRKKYKSSKLNLHSKPWRKFANLNSTDYFNKIWAEKEKIKRDYSPAYLGEFSEMNKKWNTSNSNTTHQRLKQDKSEWIKYHQLYSKSRETWDEIPYKEIAKKINVRPDWVVGDFGCGENLLSKEITNKIYAFDHIAIDNTVTACDITNVPLEDNFLDVAVFSLSLMGTNYEGYLKEAYRTLKSMGIIYIAEPYKRWEDKLDQLKNALSEIGFKMIGDVEHNYKFIYITLIK